MVFNPSLCHKEPVSAQKFYIVKSIYMTEAFTLCKVKATYFGTYLKDVSLIGIFCTATIHANNTEAVKGFVHCTAITQGTELP